MHQAENIKLSHARIRSILNNPEKTAAAARLVYVSDTQPGIKRVRYGKRFVYLLGRKRIKDTEMLQRIRSLVIPPAWEDVWICRHENGHLQATGLDLKRRKQYRYHPVWNSLRNHTKFYRLLDFGKALPAMRRRMEKDLSMKGLPPEKVLAAVVLIMEETRIRIGNALYEKLYGSFGLTTLKDQHVKLRGSSLSFMFRGKKGISHHVSLRSARLAKIVMQCRDIPGKELFQYLDENGERRCVDSGMVNDYIREISGADFTAKDFRTWAGTVEAIRAFSKLPPGGSETEKKRTVNAVLDEVARHLGNTRNVCRKYYVHPTVIRLYESDRLHAYLAGRPANSDDRNDLDRTEKILMGILQKHRMAA
jgi:DNA topoisomerase I